MNGLFVDATYVLYDPADNVVRTYYYERSYESEINRHIKVTVQVANNQDDVAAVNAYHELLNQMYLNFGGGVPPEQNYVDFYSPSGALQGTVTPKMWIYDLLRGSAPVRVPFPSYEWTNTGTNKLAVGEHLRQAMIAEWIQSTLSIEARRAVAELLVGLPLQVTVIFDNGDSLTFFLDCVQCSVAFLPLEETAADANGDKLNNQAVTGGGAGGGTGGYGSFYNGVDDLGLSPSIVCTIVETGPTGQAGTQQRVCWIVYQ